MTGLINKLKANGNCASIGQRRNVSTVLPREAQSLVDAGLATMQSGSMSSRYVRARAGGYRQINYWSAGVVILKEGI